MPDAANVTARPRRRKIDWSGIAVAVGGIASIVHLFVVVLFFLGAYHKGWIPVWARQEIAAVATDWFLVYLGIQIWSTFARNQTSGFHVAVDQVTSYLSISGSVIVLTLWIGGVLLIGAEGWRVFRWMLLVNMCEVLLLIGSFKLVATARDEVSA